MNNYLMTDLNPKQKEACEATSGPSLIIAGAGSGKTRVLTYRIAYLIDVMGVHPSSILAITFTNKAAKEMRDRLEKLIGTKAKWVTASTFHSFCANFLRKEIGILGRSTRFTIIDDDETEKIIKNICKSLNYDTKVIKPDYFINAISNIKSRIKTIDSYDPMFKDKILNVYNLYEEELNRDNLLDFDDLILYALRILEGYPEVLEKYQNIYRYILVDEFQDTSNIQYDFVNILAKKNRNIFIVGDEDQSIYSFRGANIKNIRKFMNDYPEYKKYVLDQNYRSTKNILDTANKLISHNKDRIPKDLWTSKREGEEVKLNPSDSDKTESREIVREIERLHNFAGIDYKDIAILYRNNYLSRNIENELIFKHIPYKIYSGISFYKRKEVKDMISYMRLALDDDDFYSFKRVINSPKRGVGETSIAKIEDVIKQYGLSVKDAFVNAGLQKSTTATITGFFTMIDELKALLEKLTLKEFLNELYKITGYQDYVDTLDDDEAETREENVKELFNAILETQSETVKETLEDYLDNVTLMTDLDLESPDEDTVSLMTMHTSKGLEFNTVFLMGLEDGILPSPRAFFGHEKEEERRLFYVALTRAKERLYLTYAKDRFVNGHFEGRSPSPFLKEIIDKSIIKPKEVSADSIRKSYESVYNVKKETKKGKFNIGDRVYHDVFKAGEIKAEVEGFYIIKFDEIKSMKKIIVDHPMLKKEK